MENLYFMIFSWGFPDSSIGKESAWNAGDPGSIPGLGRSAGEGIGYPFQYSWASLVPQLVKKSSCNAGDLGLIPGLGRSPGEEKDYPLWYSGLENPKDGGAWWAAVYGVAQSQTQLKRLSSSSSKSSSFPCGPAAKESSCNVGDLGSIPGLGSLPW